MQELFKEKLKWFIGGGVIGWFTGLHLLFDGKPTGGDLAFEYVAKFVATIMLTFVSGLTTVIVHDLYKEKIKHILFKKKDDTNNKKQEKDKNSKGVTNNKK